MAARLVAFPGGKAGAAVQPPTELDLFIAKIKQLVALRPHTLPVLTMVIDRMLADSVGAPRRPGGF